MPVFILNYFQNTEPFRIYGNIVYLFIQIMGLVVLGNHLVPDATFYGIIGYGLYCEMILYRFNPFRLKGKDIVPGIFRNNTQLLTAMLVMFFSLQAIPIGLFAYFTMPNPSLFEAITFCILLGFNVFLLYHGICFRIETRDKELMAKTKDCEILTA